MTCIPVRQSTALETAIGPVLDASGVAVTGGVVGDLKIKKTTGNFAALNASATLTHVSAGVYDLVLTTSDTDTVGLCCIAMDDGVNACSPLFLQVMEEAIYDAMYAASANAFAGAAGSTTLTALATGSITAAVIADGAIDAATFAAGAITATVIADGAIDAGAIAADAITAAKIADGAIDAATFAAGAINAAAIASDAITDAKVASDVTIASVTGAVGSVTGNVGGNVVGSVASVTAGVTLANGAHGGAAATLRLGSTSSTPALLIGNTGGNAVKITGSSTGGGTAADAALLIQNTAAGEPVVAFDGVDDVTSINSSGAITAPINSIGTGAITAAAVATGAIDADALAADAGTEIGTAVWATAARTLTAATNITSTGGTTVPQTGDSFARLGAPAGASVSADILTLDNFIDTEVAAILALLDDARAEPGQGAPPVNPDLATKIDYLYKAWRNKKTQTSTTLSLFADDASTVDQKSTISDDGTTATVGEIATGP